MPEVINHQSKEADRDSLIRTFIHWRNYYSDEDARLQISNPHHHSRGSKDAFARALDQLFLPATLSECGLVISAGDFRTRCQQLAVYLVGLPDANLHLRDWIDSHRNGNLMGDTRAKTLLARTDLELKKAELAAVGFV